jgi:hypothetical protein
VVRRNSEADLKIRHIFVAVDELPDRTVLFGHETEFELPAGTYVLRATNRLFSKKVTLQLAAGETAVFTVANVAAGCLFAFTIMSGAAACKLVLKRD